MRTFILMVAALLLGSSVALGGGVELTLRTPAGMKVKSATAVNPDTKLEAPGAIDGQSIHFKNLLPDTPYSVQLTLKDGTVLQGVDMGWYDAEPAKKDAEPLSDDDRAAIAAVLQQVKGFTNKNDVLLLRGDHSRAVLLAQLVRDTGFHSDKGGEVIWRVELWYYTFNYGGWVKVSQQNKVLRRERFASQDAYHQVIDKLKWVPELGGIRVSKSEGAKTITLQPPGK